MHEHATPYTQVYVCAYVVDHLGSIIKCSLCMWTPYG